MSLPIAPIQSAVTPTADAGRAAKVSHAARDFESVLVRQLLKASKVGGESKGGYGDMAVDALADGVEKGGGLGLAQCIETALSGRVR
jgi:Rod binding domain-containing protein